MSQYLFHLSLKMFSRPEVLKEHVDQRGLELPEKGLRHRRPRSCPSAEGLKGLEDVLLTIKYLSSINKIYSIYIYSLLYIFIIFYIYKLI